MTVLTYRIKKIGKNLFRWEAHIGGEHGEIAGQGGPCFWSENDTSLRAFLRKRAQQLAKRNIFESIRVQMAN